MKDESGGARNIALNGIEYQRVECPSVSWEGHWERYIKRYRKPYPLTSPVERMLKEAFYAGITAALQAPYEEKA